MIEKTVTVIPSSDFIQFRDDVALVTKAILESRPITGDQMVEDALNALMRLVGEPPQ